jgi:signal transduction histidine kinase
MIDFLKVFSCHCRRYLTIRRQRSRNMAERLLEPFRRLTTDRAGHGGGAGLGLSIVRSITTAHGGTVRARPRPEGGLIVQIDLPPASPADGQ